MHFWDGLWGARLCSVTIPGRIERAELVDAGDTLGVLVSGEMQAPPHRGRTGPARTVEYFPTPWG